jgi:glutamate receptor ionotropic, NMDA 3A
LRAEVIDFSAPYFHSGVSLLAAPKVKTDIPLLAFLMPFSFELWLAIFIWLNLTAVAVAIYEWLSPFGLNPWGRQRSKNFSLSSGECFFATSNFLQMTLKLFVSSSNQ